jgi:hypothetical protein
MRSIPVKTDTVAQSTARRRHVRPVALPVLAAALLGAVPALAVSTRARASAPKAHAARLIRATDTAHLRYQEAAGSLLVEEGPAVGTLPGTVKGRFDVGPTVTASFTIYTRGGTLVGRGTGTLHSGGEYASFSGTMTVNRGTGRYARAHGHGGFYGTVDRRTYAVVVQTTGTLSY